MIAPFTSFARVAFDQLPQRTPRLLECRWASMMSLAFAEEPKAVPLTSHSTVGDAEHEPHQFVESEWAHGGGFSYEI